MSQSVSAGPVHYDQTSNSSVLVGSYETLSVNWTARHKITRSDLRGVSANFEEQSLMHENRAFIAQCTDTVAHTIKTT